MKNNLNEQISNIKRLMLLNEQCGSDLDQCEEDLQDKGYLVYNPTEKAARGKDCDDLQIIKDIKKIMKDGGITAPRSDKSPNGNCYVEFKSDEGYGPSEGYNKFWNKNYIFMFANGSISVVRTINPSEDRKSTSGKKYFQYMYSGTIDNISTIASDGYIKLKDFEYDASYYEYDTNTPVKTVWELKSMNKNVNQIFPRTGKLSFTSGEAKFSN